jgi:predicted acetyltransferase
MIIDLVRASRSNSRLVESLLDDYLGELSNYRDVSVGATSSVSYPYLDAYWSEVGRHIFLIQYSEQVVGFAFVRNASSTESVTHQVAEFYVSPDSRRLGIGCRAILEIWKLFPGQWELQVHARNTTAVRFWESCIESGAKENLKVREVKASDGRRLQFNFRTEQTT